MNVNPFLLLVTDLLGRSGAYREETIVGPIEIEMDLERVEADHPVTVQVRSRGAGRRDPGSRVHRLHSCTPVQSLPDRMD